MRYPAILLAAHAALVVMACRDALFSREGAAPETRAAVAGPPSPGPLAPSPDLLDSLMLALQLNERDVASMDKVAEVYMKHGWFDQALGPLARALELDPYRRKRWVMLGRALEGSGREQVTDAELTEAARRFMETVRMWGEGC